MVSSRVAHSYRGDRKSEWDKMPVISTLSVSLDGQLCHIKQLGKTHREVQDGKVLRKLKSTINEKAEKGMNTRVIKEFS